jgi:hypothetical protein
VATHRSVLAGTLSRLHCCTVCVCACVCSEIDASEMVIEALVVGLWGIFAVELVSASLWTARPLTHSRTHARTHFKLHYSSMLTAIFRDIHSLHLQTVLILSTRMNLPHCPLYLALHIPSLSLRYLPRHRGRPHPMIVYPFTQTQTQIQPQHPSVNINIPIVSPPHARTPLLSRSPVHMHMHPYPLSQLRTTLSFFSVI